MGLCINGMLTDVCQGSHTTFKKVYEEPIVLSQQPSATAEEKRLGENRANEVLNQQILYFIICIYLIDQEELYFISVQTIP